jgi:thiol-disulfide isomerase/thioredoxin
LDGKPVTLTQFKGKAVFLNFWSTSCGACIAEMPGINRLSDSLKDKQIVFAAVTQEPEKDVRNFVKKNIVGVPVYPSGERSLVSRRRIC